MNVLMNLFQNDFLNESIILEYLDEIYGWFVKDTLCEGFDIFNKKICELIKEGDHRINDGFILKRMVSRLDFLIVRLKDEDALKELRESCHFHYEDVDLNRLVSLGILLDKLIKECEYIIRLSKYSLKAKSLSLY